MPCLKQLKTRNFHHFDIEDIVKRELNSQALMDMTFCPVLDDHREVVNSSVFAQSPLFGVQSIWARTNRINVKSFVKVIK